ncbi:GNAT family acetyltransferase [Rhodotorula taiwanensis]|uniref:GNAT family acetyltransferase n=1 Tax=Rhodotorula taiwanensis TaxID=741276 RepID=A0A2S5BGU0_9BASI|nr:GNAT family acetyltransferase [Rhodotorula taiwanensis]
MFCTIDDLHPWSQGKGYGREAMEWLLSRAFVGYGLNRVQSACWTWNEPAVRLYKSVGFQVEGTKRQACWQEGAFRDEYIIAILAEDYHKRRSESLG